MKNRSFTLSIMVIVSLLRVIKLLAVEPAARLHLTGGTNGAPMLQLSGASGRYRIDASSDLRTWQPIATNILTGPPILIPDAASAGQPHRFYRAVPLDNPAYQPGVVLVRFKPTASDASVAGALAAVPLAMGEGIWTSAMQDAGHEPIYVMATTLPVEEAVRLLKNHPAVAFAEPNRKLTHTTVSNDPKFTHNLLWGMYGDLSSPANAFGSQAAEAWAQGYTGSRQVYVGVIDEGIQFDHPDLAGNVWTNPFEIPDNGIDDDGNGYVDDVHGWNFYDNDNFIFDGSSDDPFTDAHGTHVAGTIGALGGNALGVAGVNWNVTIIPGKFLGPSGGYINDAVKAVDYFTDLKRRHGLNIVALNNSWGGGGDSQALHDAIIRAAKVDILFIAAAGNDGTDNDNSPAFPSNFDTTLGTSTESPADYDAVIAVAAIDVDGSLALFRDEYGDVLGASAYGAQTVDLGAPGVGIWSTVPWRTYDSYQGTSMATPHVTGAAALYASTHPGESAAQIRQALLGSTIPTPSLAGKCVTGGRLNLSTVIQPTTPPPPPVTPPKGLNVTSAASSAVALAWTDNSDNEVGFLVQRSINNLNYTDLATLPQNSTAFTDNTVIGGQRYWYRVRAFNSSRNSDWSNVASVTAPVPPPLEAPRNLRANVGVGRVVLTWQDNSGNETGFRIERSAQGESFTLLAIVGVNVTSYADTTVVSGRAYSYRVRAFNADGHSAWNRSMPAPDNVSASPTGPTSARISWQNNAGALASTDHFEIWQKRDDQGSYVFGENVPWDRSNAERTGLSPNHTYCFKVRVQKDGQYSDLSASEDCVALVLSAPSGVSASATGPTSARVSWQNNAGALASTDHFEIWQKRDDQGSYVFGENVPWDRSNAERTGLSANHAYCFKVRVQKDGQYSDLSAGDACATLVLPPVAAPTLTRVNANGCHSFQICWQNNAGSVDHYEIWQSLDGVNYVFGENVPNTFSCAVRDNLQAGRTYWFKVRAWATDGRASDWSSAGADVYSIPAPSGVSATATTTGAIRVGWRNNAGTVDRFEIWQRRADRADYSFGENVPPDRTDAVRDGLVSGRRYYFKVLAVKGDCKSVLSTSEPSAVAP